ncbi:hypothetical protein VHUM_00037 [Vanrija humicola]|uniref:TauD/TfdA-like domain-containing protein n=1 Tax=Vanrija humicola TaxID=5417 RepID=A0A7D8V1W6_VANHU|nr:hypothetical protein VHUM_00037 [Vanrija humicola]
MATAIATASSAAPSEASLTPFFEPFALPATNQRELGAPHAPGTVTPLALRPTSELTLDQAIDTVKQLQQDKTLTKLLASHGTLLFRGLPINNATEFSRFAHAFGWRPHEIIGIVVDRPLLAPNVAPANESPKEVEIYNHNESPQVPHAPEYIFFYGHKVPEIGGETPISSSLELFQRAQAEIPEFIEKITQEGILSRVVYKVDAQYAGGSTLRQAFGKEIEDGDDAPTRRAKIEKQLQRYARGEHTTWEWKDDATLEVTHRLPVVRTQPSTGLPTLFTGLAAYYRRLKQNWDNKAVAVQYYGDGTEISKEHLAKLEEITDDIRVLHKWHRGDVLVYDNIISQHGRQPWGGEQGDRVVQASLFDGDQVPGAFNNQPWAQVVQALDG